MFAVVLLPLVATFWISVKPVQLTDLRAPEPIAKLRVKGEPTQAGDQLSLQFRLRNSSQYKPVENIRLQTTMPAGIVVDEATVDQRCGLDGQVLQCDFGTWEPKHRERMNLTVTAQQAWFDNPVELKKLDIEMSGKSENVLTNFSFTTDNFKKIFDAHQFTEILWVTMVYTFGGTIGALVMGLFAAQLLQREFRGRSIFRGLFLFPYVAPVIAMAFTWLVLFDPYSGVLNALLKQMGAIDESINFFGTKDAPIYLFGLEMSFPVALSMVIAFEVWRYFPLSFMFILARMQSTPTDMFEAAEMDGASPLQQFWHLALPQFVRYYRGVVFAALYLDV